MNYLEWIGKIGQIMSALQLVRGVNKGEKETVQCSITYKYKGERYRLVALTVTKD